MLNNGKGVRDERKKKTLKWTTKGWNMEGPRIQQYVPIGSWLIRLGSTKQMDNAMRI